LLPWKINQQKTTFRDSFFLSLFNKIWQKVAWVMRKGGWRIDEMSFGISNKKIGENLNQILEKMKKNSNEFKQIFQAK